MVLKLNKALLAIGFILTFCTTLKAQDEVYTDSITEYSDTVQYSEDTYEDVSDFQAWYHFSDSEQYVFNNQIIVPKFDSAYWKKLTKDINFEEKTPPKKEKPKKKQAPKSSSGQASINIGDYKFLFITIALLLLGLFIFYLIRNTGPNNKKVTTSLLINLNELDEKTLKEAELRTPLDIAIRNKDFKTAYRLRYLQVLQQLIGKNLIVYSKEKTNYEYLMQLSGKTAYEPFRMLTFNFDGIWYGELHIDEQRYNSLLPYFESFEKTMSGVL